MRVHSRLNGKWITEFVALYSVFYFLNFVCCKSGQQVKRKTNGEVKHKSNEKMLQEKQKLYEQLLDVLVALTFNANLGHN